MKHLFTIVLTVCLFGTVAAQDTVSGPDGKLNGWYASYWMYDCFEYYDTNDYTNFLHRPNLINLFTHSHENYMILGKGERVKYPAAVKGVSVLVKDWREYLGRSASWKVADTNRLPEYIYIYQRGPAIDSEDYFHSLILLASVRWDTAKCQI